MKQREIQTEWFVDLIEEHRNGRDIKILGKIQRANIMVVHQYC